MACQPRTLCGLYWINKVSMTSVVSAQGGPPATHCLPLMLAQRGPVTLGHDDDKCGRMGMASAGLSVPVSETCSPEVAFQEHQKRVWLPWPHEMLFFDRTSVTLGESTASHKKRRSRRPLC